MKAVVAAFNQEKALVGAFSVITTLRMELFQALAGRADTRPALMGNVSVQAGPHQAAGEPRILRCKKGRDQNQVSK